MPTKKFKRKDLSAKHKINKISNQSLSSSEIGNKEKLQLTRAVVDSNKTDRINEVVKLCATGQFNDENKLKLANKFGLSIWTIEDYYYTAKEIIRSKVDPKLIYLEASEFFDAIKKDCLDHKDPITGLDSRKVSNVLKAIDMQFAACGLKTLTINDSSTKNIEKLQKEIEDKLRKQLLQEGYVKQNILPIPSIDPDEDLDD